MNNKFDNIDEVMNHIANVWECKDKNFDFDGCYEYHDELFEIEIDKEDYSIFLRFNIKTLPSVVSELTRNLHDFCCKHDLILIIGDDFFIENNVKMYGDDANDAFNRMIYYDVKVAVENEQVLDDLLNTQDLTEC